MADPSKVEWGRKWGRLQGGKSKGQSNRKPRTTLIDRSVPLVLDVDITRLAMPVAPRG